MCIKCFEVKIICCVINYRSNFDFLPLNDENTNTPQVCELPKRGPLSQSKKLVFWMGEHFDRITCLTALLVWQQLNMSTMAYLTADLGFYNGNNMMMPSFVQSMPSIQPSHSTPSEVALAPSISSTSSSMRTSINKSYQCSDDLLLPGNFKPSAYSVICGRGRRSTQAFGNRRLRVIASLFVKRYENAAKKEDKSRIVTEIHEIIRNACPDSRHAFVRYSKGKWWTVQNLHAREKIGTVLRDCLHSKYKSSTKSKLAKRKRKLSQQLDPAQLDLSFGIAPLEQELSAEEFDSLFEWSSDRK